MYYQLINFGNEEFHAYPNKSLYWKRLNTLIVSDLHIGKSISYAKNKQFYLRMIQRNIKQNFC